jgi:hypothetical protein
LPVREQSSVLRTGVNDMINIFGDFSPLFGNEIGVFLENQLYDPFFVLTSSM